MTGLLHSLRSSGTPWRRSPRARYRLTDRPDCSACTVESRSPSPRPANREDRRSLDLRLLKGTTVGSKPRWSQRSTRIARQQNGRAPGRGPSADQPQPPPLFGYMQLAISRSFRAFVSPEPRLPICALTISITLFWRPDHPFSVRSRGSPFCRGEESECLTDLAKLLACGQIEWT